MRTSATSSCGNHQASQILDLDPKASSHLKPLEITDDTKVIEHVNDVPDTNGRPTTIATSPPIMQDAKENTQPYQQVTSSVNSARPEANNKSDGVNKGTSTTTTSTSTTSVSSIEKLTLEILKLEKQIHELQQETSADQKSPESRPQNEAVEKANGWHNGQEISSSHDKVVPPTITTTTTTTTPNAIDSGFLQGLSISPSNTQNEALMKLNQSTKIEPQDMQSAIQSTVPNVVSNIFSNIQNLTQLTENGQTDGSTPNQGSSIVKGNTTAEITASGEALFLAWLNAQIDTLHLTASMANQVRKSSMNLFRRIVKQYVESMQKIGGTFEDNMRQATQTALNNTQSLIGFLLKNYINFASGLMQIIGEQVSRVGKQLDSTGETIAHVNLNPFDIVSNVMESLPNPTDYSKYFRDFGKQLMGQFMAGQQQQQQQQQDDLTKVNDNTQDTGNQASSERPKGLFSKTMGALSKTLGSWLG